jgi:Protein of unknown function (DUF3035)
MSIDDRCRGRRRALIRWVLFALAAGPTLAGCDSVKQAIGLESVPPDEFAIETQAPLTIPPDFDLRPPKPGAPRPQGVSSEATAERLLAKAKPGKPIASRNGKLPDLLAAGGGPNPNAEIRPQSLSQKLLSFNGTGGVTIEKRKTKELKDVY